MSAAEVLSAMGGVDSGPDGDGDGIPDTADDFPDDPGEWIDTDVVSGLLQRHRQGVGDHSDLLWSVLVLARFLERWAP